MMIGSMRWWEFWWPNANARRDDKKIPIAVIFARSRFIFAGGRRLKQFARKLETHKQSGAFADDKCFRFAASPKCSAFKSNSHNVRQFPHSIRIVPTFVIPCLIDEEDELWGSREMVGKDAGEDVRFVASASKQTKTEGFGVLRTPRDFVSTHSSLSHFLEIFFPKKRCQDCTRMQNEGSFSRIVGDWNQNILPTLQECRRILGFLKWMSSSVIRIGKREIFTFYMSIRRIFWKCVISFIISYHYKLYYSISLYVWFS